VIVLDASAATDFLLERGALGGWVAERLAEAQSVHAPHLIDSEVTSAARQLAARGEATAEMGDAVVAALEDMPILRYPAWPLLERIWQLRSTLTAFDATYVALAEALEAPFVTTDGRLARAAGHGAAVTAFPG